MTWSPVTDFWVPGAAKAQPRAKGRVMPLKGWGSALSARTPRDLMGLLTVAIYTPDVAREWKAAVRRAAHPHRPAEPLAGPLRVELDFLMPRPKYMDARRYDGRPELHGVKPDADNLAKAVLDALGDDKGWWGDDAQVCELAVQKHYHGRAGSPGCGVRVMALADAQAGLFADSDADPQNDFVEPNKKVEPEQAQPGPSRAVVVPTPDGRWRVEGGPPGAAAKPFKSKLEALRAADRINDAGKPDPLAAPR